MLQSEYQEMMKNLTDQQVMQYNKIKQNHAEISKVYIEIENEKKEHILVLDAIKNIDSKRRCWRMIGGVLVERQLDDVQKSLKENLELLEKNGQNYNTAMKQIEKELTQYELTHNLRPQQNQQSQQQQQQQPVASSKTQGVLT
ncbi:unnamed protein product [Paramecium octaurelia]|uniref:Prefoldin subunit 2 n=1 Tax=Paramecium octaurelia TaxID=43137 RepID=A0A8S1VJH9_PAROT|nr:unnamed protein product [Paramecium octaurelia]